MPRRMRAAAALALASALAACAAPPGGPPGTPPGAVRVCDDKGCGYRDPTVASFVPQDDPRATRQADPDAYRGESLAELRAGAQAGDAVAAYKLGQVYLYGLAGTPRNASLAAGNFGIATDQGHPWAQYRLAEMLLNGQGVPRNVQRGTELTFAAAKSGQAQAAHNLGMAYLQGNGLPRDSGEAARWLTVAAEHGVPEAQYNLGLLYERGDGVPRQLYDALQWMRQAAQGGYLPAQVAVGRFYMTGLDTMGQDLQEARTWLTTAAGRGNADAKRWLAEMDRAESEEQEQGRKLQLLEAQTAMYLAGAVLAAALEPPPVYVVAY